METCALAFDAIALPSASNGLALDYKSNASPPPPTLPLRQSMVNPTPTLQSDAKNRPLGEVQTLVLDSR